MSSRRSWAVGLLSASVVAGVVLVLVGTAAGDQQPEDVRALSDKLDDPEVIAQGRSLFERACVSCHGDGGQGSDFGPSLLSDGATGADFMLRTGRMPLASPVPQAPSKPQAFSDEETDALVAYVTDLAEDRALPVVEAAAGDLVLGGELFRANCAPCHNASAIGGALSFGQHAPSLLEVPGQQIGEAMRFGPGEMPVFGEDVFSDHEMNSIVRYVDYLKDPDDPGGLSLGRIGPVTEGFAAWIIGMAALLIGIRWVTAKLWQRRTEETEVGV